MRDRVFGKTTGFFTGWPSAVQRCLAQGSVPASAAEIWAFRLEADGANHANGYFATSTAAIYFIADGKPSVAFYDTQRNDGLDNLLITRAQEGYDAHRASGKWLVPLQDDTLKGMIKDAEQRNRIISPGARTLSLGEAYATDDSTRAILCDNTLAADVEDWLGRKGYSHGHHWLLSAQQMSQLGVNHEYAELRRVGVGGGDVYGSNDLGAGGLCNGNGRARGVVRKNSTGSKG
jgi:hypothetical protein